MQTGAAARNLRGRRRNHFHRRQRKPSRACDSVIGAFNMPPLDQWQHRLRANTVLIRLSGAAVPSDASDGRGRIVFRRSAYPSASKAASDGSGGSFRSENEVSGNARPHPGPFPQERGKHASCPEFSCFLLWHRPMGTLVGRGRVRVGSGWESFCSKYASCPAVGEPVFDTFSFSESTQGGLGLTSFAKTFSASPCRRLV